MAGPQYDLRTELAELGSAWINAAPEDKPLPFMVVYLITRERLTNQTQEYLFRVDCAAKTFAAAQALADAIHLKDDWPWPVVYESEKDEYQTPEDAGEIIHVVSVHLILHAE